ncbi:MAG: hypothetical protein HC906_11700 [Bacteroidales bacterium]|nr:hypothetical protein [Bacteroidales bacterium]
MINEDGWFKYSVGDFDDFESANKFRSQSGLKNAFIVAYRKGTLFQKPEDKIEKETEIIETKIPVVASTVSSENNSGLLFRVQVAANRVALRKEQIAKICSSGYAIEQVEEDGWYKYQITGVRLFSDALKIIRDVKVDNAFIIAYENGIKYDLYEAVKRSAKIEKEIQIHGRKGKLNDIEFHVQLAASKRALKAEELTSIYSGGLPVSLYIEDDWYKYRINAGFNYTEAKTLRTIVE